MRIDEEIRIGASLAKVWEAFTDLTCWADWNSVLTDVRPRSGSCIDEKGRFACCVSPYGVPVFFEAHVDEVSPMKRVVWTGSKYLVRGRHEFLFAEKNGAVELVSREVLSGLPVAFGGLFFPVRKFRAMTRTFLDDLRTHAEET